MLPTLQQERAHAELKAALLGVLIAHQNPDDPESYADGVTASIQCEEDGFAALYELTREDRGHAIPVGGGSL